MELRFYTHHRFDLYLRAEAHPAHQQVKGRRHVPVCGGQNRVSKQQSADEWPHKELLWKQVWREWMCTHRSCDSFRDAALETTAFAVATDVEDEMRKSVVDISLYQTRRGFPI